MLNRRYYLALAIVVVVTLMLFKLPSRAAGGLKRAFGGFFLPLFGLKVSASHVADKASAAVVPRAELVKQLETSEREVQELKIRLSQAEELSRENARLRQSVGFLKQSPWKLKPARVIGRDPANWWKTMRIDVGSRDGIVPNLPVLIANETVRTNQWPGASLVGRISDVGYSWSQVLLLGNPDCRVSVMIEDTREHGVIAPASSLDNTVVELSYLSRNCKLVPGQRVTTSGDGGVFPKGIIVGQVVDWKSVGYGLSTEARVKVQVNINALEEVFVKIP